MNKAKIKDEHKMTQIGFNGSALPLGFRDDLDLLAQEAIRSQDVHLLSLFETLPSEDDLKESAGEKFLKDNPAVENTPVAKTPVDKEESKTVSK